MKPFFALILSALVSFPVACSLQAADSDEAEIRSSLADDFEVITEALNDPELTESQKSDILKRQLHNRLALGPLASKAIGNLAEDYTFEEVVTFSQEFQEYLLNFCVERMLIYGGSKIEIESIEQVDDTHYSVTTVGRELKGNQQKKLAIDGRATNRYVVEKRGGEWRIVDITLGGVNVAGNFHSQFVSTLKRNDARSLFKTIRDSNKRNR